MTYSILSESVILLVFTKMNNPTLHKISIVINNLKNTVYKIESIIKEGR